MGVLKYDQWYHHWACVLTALQKCKADSDYYYHKLLTYTQAPIRELELLFPTQHTSTNQRIGIALLQSTQQHHKQQQQHTSVIAKSEQRAHAAQQIAHGAVLGTAPEKLIDPKT